MKRENTKDKILEKALELFSANGYDSVSVGEIARAVGIKAPSIYNHYPSKQAIFDAIVKETAERYEKFTNDIDIHVQNADADTDVFSNITEEFLIQKVRSIFLYSLHDNAISRFRRMMTIEQFRSAELSELYTNRYVKRLVDYHSGIFKNLISNGEIIDENTETLALMYVSPILTLLDRQPEKEDECLKRLDAHIRVFYESVNTGERGNKRKGDKKA